ncbi:MAG: aconitate hydratase AcnA [Myxococcales bacterium]|nr:aconitate hydratase AcnA [Myxococcales bacterium]
MRDSFGSRSTLAVGGQRYEIFRLAALERRYPGVARLPFCLKILLENLLRHEDGGAVTADDVTALATLDPTAEPSREIAFSPARVLLQDFTGVPAMVDLAAMRDAMRRLGGDPGRINPLVPVELVIDHSVQVDDYGSRLSFGRNAARELERNRERYRFLKWGQKALARFLVVPPDTGIVHQVNLERLARVVMTNDAGQAYPDTLVGTDSHTTMINGLGVLGWGCGGIEAEAAMLGQPVSMLIPKVLGVRLSGALREGATATDVVLTVTERLRRRGVVGMFVELFGPGLAELSLADRATIANMAPEYGATAGIFPIDAETLRYLRSTGRPAAQVALVEAYARAQGLFHEPGAPEAHYAEVLALDLGEIEPSVAGPTRPQDRVPLGAVKQNFAAALATMLARTGEAERAGARVALELDGAHELGHGALVIAAITSCTNTSNPSVMLAAGLVAKKAVERGLGSRPWVKTSLAPGSKVVTAYLDAAGLTPHLEALGFHLVGYGCTTCIGNSGPLPEPVSRAIAAGRLVAAAVLSGNRNFEGRVHPEVRANYLASPPLVVAYALAGRVDLDLTSEPLGHGADGAPVYLRDVWPSRAEVEAAAATSIRDEMFAHVYSDLFTGDETWAALEVPEGELFGWDESSSYVKHPPYFAGLEPEPAPVGDLVGARALAVFGDSITTDHISPAGDIRADGPAGKYLAARGVARGDFNSYGSRRGNHEVMVRGTFANVRLRNRLAPGTEGGVTRHLPSGEVTSIYEAAVRYEREDVPLVVLAGKEYGSGSSRDWAAKGPRLLGVRAVLAESFERIHRQNLVGMGILPLEYLPGESAATHALTGEEHFDVRGLARHVAAVGEAGPRLVDVEVRREDGTHALVRARLRIDTPAEARYYAHGGILPYVLRRLAREGASG